MKSGTTFRITLEEALKRPSKMDWGKINATTEEDIERQIAEDPDLQGLENIDWSKAVFVEAPLKQAISIRLDADVLDFFKAQGSGYQGRINSVLRYYMENIKKPAE